MKKTPIIICSLILVYFIILGYYCRNFRSLFGFQIVEQSVTIQPEGVLLETYVWRHGDIAGSSYLMESSKKNSWFRNVTIITDSLIRAEVIKAIADADNREAYDNRFENRKDEIESSTR